MLLSEPVRRLSMQTTSHSRARRNSHRWEPMKPAPPVTRTRMASGRDDGLAPDRVVLEAESAHALRLPEVAPVEDERPPEQPPQPLEVQVLELVPLRDEGDGVGALRRRVGRIAEADAVGDEGARVVHGHGVVAPDARDRKS